MANGDAAAAAGMAVVAGTADLRQGYDEDNKTRDYLAGNMTTGTHPASAINAGILPQERGGTGVSALNPNTIAGANPGSRLTDDLNYLGGQASAARSTADAARAGVMTSDVYNRPITGPRNVLYAQNDGLLGYASSSRYRKQDFTVPDITVDQLRAVHWTLYRYRIEVVRAKREPDYHPQLEIGMLAEDLHTAGLWPFVMYDEAGKPFGIRYELLGLAALELAQRAWDAIDELRDDVAALKGER